MKKEDLQFQQSIEVFTWYDLEKLHKAYQEKYNIPSCDGMPYTPKGIRVILIAETVQ